ncbi:flagellar hook-length control protein FliK [Paludibacterium paludis]|uniref:Flagellar hook-length control protein-like C-terminal domain-containing protein n=1 Tax=Paludibacterium paludis TaxID=1225769 RepID=A0A918P656_9NEIS|nr:flagellar hook-length control protein FliK [Paludibacterium paludis]GGY29662.1 hypothetical protein GCM10011289_35720 [Paludibacterium paludis]
MIGPINLPSTLDTQPISPIRLLTEGGKLLIEVASSPEKLPSLILGEQVTGRIAERLGNDQLAVLIKNGLFTLNLPKGTPVSGDTLSLRVASLKPELTFVLNDTAQEGASKDSSVEVSLSRTSRYLTDLLRVGDKAERPAKALNLDASQDSPPHLAQAMRKDVQKSGLFYESHLKAWNEGRMPLEDLRQEPQATLTKALADPRHPAGAEARAELGKLVQQQLMTQETQQLPLQGLAWPGQPVSVLIEQDKTDDREGGHGNPEDQAWTTSLSLSLPAMGGLDARLRLVGGSVQVTFLTDSERAGELIREHGRRLEEGLELAGIQLATLVVKHEAPQS